MNFDEHPLIQLSRRIERGETHESDHKTYEAARDLAEKLGDLLNGGSHGPAQAGLLVGLLKQHRYLNNEAIIAVLTALGEFGRLNKAAVADARNSFAYDLCRKLRDTFRSELFWHDQ